MLRHLISFIAIYFLIMAGSCGEMANPDPNNGGGNDSTKVVWSGAKIIFTKSDGSDPSVEANQDRITENVWITRSNNGGGIYNAKSELGYNKGLSPKDTEWAFGTASNLSGLSFNSLRNALGEPKSLVGKNLVLHLKTDDVYLDLKFTSWSEKKAGGFTYERSTKE